MTGERSRVFVGVPLPEEVLPFVEETQAALPDHADMRVTRAEQLHLTLCFLGEVEATKVERAVRVVSAVPCTMGGVVLLGGYVCLPSEARARVVALDVDDPEGVLTALYEWVASGMERQGVFEREARPFRPHLTIARLGRPCRLRPTSDVRRIPLGIRSVCLYRSILSREGARYEALQSAALIDRSG